jgi:PTS system mannose-specific IIA component
MFGGEASDMSYSFLEIGKTDVISAVNLPILMRAVKLRRQVSFTELARCLTSYGKQNISLGSDILMGKRRSPASPCPLEIPGSFSRQKQDCILIYEVA